MPKVLGYTGDMAHVEGDDGNTYDIPRNLLPADATQPDAPSGGMFQGVLDPSYSPPPPTAPQQPPAAAAPFAGVLAQSSGNTARQLPNVPQARPNPQERNLPPGYSVVDGDGGPTVLAPGGEVVPRAGGVVQARPPGGQGAAAPGDGGLIVVPGQRARGGGGVRTPQLSDEQQAYLGTFEEDQRRGRWNQGQREENARQRDELLRNARIDQDIQRFEEDEANNAFRARIDDANQRFERDRQAVASAKIDPQKFWKDRGVAGAIVATLAQALGAFGAALTRGPNHAKETLNKLIEEDIAAQHASISNKREDLAEQRHGIAGLMSQYDDQRQQQTAARALAWQQVQQQLEGLAANATDIETRERAGALQQELEREQLRAQQQFQAANADAARRAAAARARAARPQAFIMVDGLPVPVDPNNQRSMQQAIELQRQGRQNAGGLDANQFSRSMSEYGERVQKLNASSQELRRLQEQANSTSDIPGVGLGYSVLNAVGAGGVGNIIAGEEGRQVQRDTRMGVERGIQAITGATATDEQRAAVRESLGIGPTSTEADYRRALGVLSQSVEEQRQGINASFPPEVVEEYARRNGGGTPSTFQEE